MRQKGFTLVEVLVVLAVGGVLLTGLVTSIFQVTTFTDRSNSQGIALADLHPATLQIKKDLQMAQDTSLTTDGVPQQDSISLDWTDYTHLEGTENHNHSCNYALSGTELRRTYDGTESIVGRNITSVVFTQDGRLVNVVITATGPGIQQRSKTIEFRVHMRAEVSPE